MRKGARLDRNSAGFRIRIEAEPQLRIGDCVLAIRIDRIGRRLGLEPEVLHRFRRDEADHGAIDDRVGADSLHHCLGQQLLPIHRRAAGEIVDQRHLAGAGMRPATIRVVGGEEADIARPAHRDPDGALVIRIARLIDIGEAIFPHLARAGVALVERLIDALRCPVIGRRDEAREGGDFRGDSRRRVQLHRRFRRRNAGAAKPSSAGDERRGERPTRASRSTVFRRGLLHRAALGEARRTTSRGGDGARARPRSGSGNRASRGRSRSRSGRSAPARCRPGAASSPLSHSISSAESAPRTLRSCASIHSCHWNSRGRSCS